MKSNKNNGVSKGFGASDARLPIPVDAQDESLAEHDKFWHKDGFDPKTDSCSKRDKLAKGDIGDKLAGGTKSFDMNRIDEILNEYEGNLARSDKWLRNNLGIPSSMIPKFDSIISSKATAGREKTLKRLAEISDGLPSDAWKPGSKKGASSKKDSVVQMLLGGGSASSFGGSSSMSSTGGSFSKYFHAQGKKSYSSKVHKPTGLYETRREKGDALAREEDIPGMSPFNKARPRFVEHGDVPASLTPQQLADFKYTANGSTYPMVGNVGGRNYIVKRGILPEGVRRNSDLQDHIRKEVAADKFIRAAGLNAPVCTTFEIPRKRADGVKIDEQKLKGFYDIVKAYKDAKATLEKLEKDDNATNGQVKKARKAKDDAKDAYKKFEASLGKDKDAYKEVVKSRVKDGQFVPYDPAMDKELVKIAEYVDGGVSLVRSWHQGTPAEKAKIRQQVIDAYPIMSFLENVDAFKNDNVLVDKDSRLWFIDNGACFDYRAQGGKKLLADDNRMSTSKNKNAKPWYYERQDPTDFTTGYLGLMYAPDQALLQDILEDVDDDDLVAAGRKYDFEALAKTLPPEISSRVEPYARKLNEALRNPPDGWLHDAD